MESTTILSRFKAGLRRFFHQVGKANEKLYLALLALYVTIFCILEIAWSNGVSDGISAFRYALLSFVMWGATLYLFFIVIGWLNLWKKTVPLILIGAAMLGATAIFSRWMSTNSYTVVMDVFFCLMAFGKDYKKILRVVLMTVGATLLIAAIGWITGFARDIVKPENVSPGHSFGIIYPNNWGSHAFLAMMIAWYLYLRRKPVHTLILFWGMAVFMYFVVSCRTIALLTVVFPVFAIAIDWLEERAKPRKTVGVLGWIIVAIPFLALAFTLYVSLNVEWVHAHFYNTPLHTMAMRFVQGGLYLRTYGFPIFGNPYRANVSTFVNVNGVFEELGILDSAFTANAIMRGAFWMAYTMLWLSIGNYKAVKRRDFAIPFLGAILLVFAMMERLGLDAWYNFVLLYPLAKVTAPVPQTSGGGEDSTASIASVSAETSGSDEASTVTSPVSEAVETGPTNT